MEGTQSPSGRMLEVTRVFEWSRLEIELMTAAYGYVVPTGRSVRVQSLPAGREPGGNGSGEPTEGRHGCLTGA
jgi:hypothetical protein